MPKRVLPLIEKRGAFEMARCCVQFSGQVFRYAIATGRAEVDPVPSLRGVMMMFVRTSELTETPWSEIDFANEVWIIKWNRMKKGSGRSIRGASITTSLKTARKASPKPHLTRMRNTPVSRHPKRSHPAGLQTVATFFIFIRP